jgi:Tfp pilus assembly protein PilN
MRAVNLLPHDARPGSRWATFGRGASARHVLARSGIAAAVLGLALAGLTLHQRSVVDDRQTELRDGQARLVVAQAKAAEVQQTQAASAARYSALKTLVAQRLAWEDVLRDLARVLPEGVFLQSLSAASPTPTTTAAGTPAAAAPGTAAAPGAVPTSFTVSGSADSQKRVARVLDRLALLPWLSDVTLQSSVRGGSAGERGTPVQFMIGATIGSTGGR